MLRRRGRPDDAPRIYTREYFQRIYELEERHWWAIGMREIIHRWLAPRLYGREGLRVLDAGCGTGLMLSWLRRYAGPGDIVGVDISSHALFFCRQRRLRQVAQASVMDMPFPDGSFDVITCSDVLQHLPRDGADARALRECLRVLRPGGLLYLRTNVWLGPPSPNGPPPEAPARIPDFHQYTRRELEELFDGAGFRVERLTYANMIPALVATGLRKLRPPRPEAGSPGDYRGLTMRVPWPWLNAALTLYMDGEARYLAGPGRRLPYGHSLLCLAVKPPGPPR